MLNMLLKDTICIEVIVQTIMAGVILYIRDNIMFNSQQLLVVN